MDGPLVPTGVHATAGDRKAPRAFGDPVVTSDLLHPAPPHRPPCSGAWVVVAVVAAACTRPGGSVGRGGGWLCAPAACPASARRTRGGSPTVMPHVGPRSAVKRRAKHRLQGVNATGARLCTLPTPGLPHKPSARPAVAITCCHGRAACGCCALPACGRSLTPRATCSANKEAACQRGLPAIHHGLRSAMHGMLHMSFGATSVEGASTRRTTWRSGHVDQCCAAAS